MTLAPSARSPSWNICIFPQAADRYADPRAHRPVPMPSDAVTHKCHCRARSRYLGLECWPLNCSPVTSPLNCPARPREMAIQCRAHWTPITWRHPGQSICPLCLPAEREQLFFETRTSPALCRQERPPRQLHVEKVTVSDEKRDS